MLCISLVLVRFDSDDETVVSVLLEELGPLTGLSRDGSLGPELGAHLLDSIGEGAVVVGEGVIQPELSVELLLLYPQVLVLQLGFVDEQVVGLLLSGNLDL